MYYFIYETTNLINNKKYIGKHISESLEDEYLGSGNLLLKAVRKYGRNNFSRNILFVFDNEDDMNEKEKELVTLDIVKSPDYYNISLGGYGGCIVLAENHPLREQTIESIKKACLSQDKRNKQSVISKQHHLEARMGLRENYAMLGKKQSEKQKAAFAITRAKNAARGYTEEERKKFSDFFKNKVYVTEIGSDKKIAITSEEYKNNKDKYIFHTTGTKVTEENKIKQSLRNSGAGNPNYGKHHSEETRKKISERFKTQQKYECPYCSNVFIKAHLTRHTIKCEKNYDPTYEKI